MSNELVVSLNSQVEPSQTEFNWDETITETKKLVQEELQLTSTIEEAQIRRYEVRVKIGHNLMAIQDAHSKNRYGDFTTKVLPELGIERTHSHRYIRMAKFSQISIVANLQRLEIPPLSTRIWDLLASPSMHLTVIKQVFLGEVEPTYQAIKEASARAWQAEEEQNKQLQSPFDFSETEQPLLTNPETVTTIYQDTPETQEQLAKLQAELAERTRQRDNLAQMRERLGQELDEQRLANKARREQELYEYQINERVKKVCEEWGRTTVQLLGLLPSPIESQVVTADNWALIEHTVDMAERTISTIHRVKSDKVTIFVDSEEVGVSSL